MNKKLAMMAVSAMCALTVGSLCVGCSGTQATTQNTEATAARTYMSQVNQTMETLDEKLDNFVDAVSRGDSVGMKTQADKALEALSALDSIETPDQLKEVQDGYKTGADCLKQALTDYVTLYTTQDASAINADQLATIQAKYDEGVAALKEADKKAAEALK